MKTIINCFKIGNKSDRKKKLQCVIEFVYNLRVSGRFKILHFF